MSYIISTEYSKRRNNINIFNIYNSIKNSKKIFLPNNKSKLKAKSVPKNSKNKSSIKNRIQAENNNKATKENKYNKSTENEEEEKTNNAVTNFIDSLFDEPVKSNTSKKEKNNKDNKDNPDKILDIKIKIIRNKASEQNIKKMNKTDIRMMNRNKKNKNINLDSQIIFNDFQKKLKINKKKFICEEKLRMINQQMYVLQKEKNKINKELSLLKIKENSLFNKSKEKTTKKKDIKNRKGMPNKKMGKNSNEGNTMKEDDPESIIKLFNSNADINGGLFPFEDKQSNQNKDNNLLPSSRSVVSDKKKKEKKKIKNIKLNINLNDLYNLKMIDSYSSRGYKSHFFYKTQLKTAPNKKHKSYGNSRDKKSKNIFFIDVKNTGIANNKRDIKNMNNIK